MDEIWDVLGIDATRDEILIRKAYAVRLRDNNPDSNPAGFQKLRAAYEAALIRRKRSAPSQEIQQVPVRPDTPQQVPEQQVQPPSPDELERIDLLQKLSQAINEKHLTDAVKFYDRGLASGILEFGRRDLVLDHILALAVDDKSLSSREFTVLLQHVGWQNRSRRNEWHSPVRQRCAMRLEAEEWLSHIERVAYGEDKPNWTRSYRPGIVIRRVLHRWRERKNASLLLGATQFFRVSRASVKSLQTLMLQYENYKPWIAHRLDPRAIARAQGILRRDDMVLGRIHRWLWPSVALLLGISFVLSALGLVIAGNPLTIFCGIIAFRLIRYGWQRLYEVWRLKLD